MLFTGYSLNGPSAVRYPRGSGPGTPIQTKMTSIPIGQGQVIQQGKKIAFLAFGSMVTPAMEAAQQLSATVANMRFVKPLDEQLIIDLASDHDLLVTVEENAISGGAGSAINEFLQSINLNIPVLNLGIPDQFIEHGSRDECLSECGLDTSGILHNIENYLQDKTCHLEKNTLVF
jgi:1-deoxy-D-xylulose-5-phosphate synthase